MTKTITVGEKVVNRIGLGTNRITNNVKAQALLKHALQIGIQFIDTADIYSANASEATIGATLAPYPQEVIVATKGGMVYGSWEADGRPEHLRSALEKSLQRLKLSEIYLYQLHRIDPKVPLAESVGALAQLQKEGKIKHLGLSEVTIAQIKEAQAIVPIVSVQNKYSLFERKYEPEVDFCEKNGIVFIPWCPLAGGKLALDHPVFTELTSKYQVTAHQLALAWLLKRSPNILPIPGTLQIKHLDENVTATTINMLDEHFVMLSNSVLNLDTPGFPVGS